MKDFYIKYMEDKFSIVKINDSIMSIFRNSISNAYDNRKNIPFEISINSSLKSFQNSPAYNKLSIYQTKAMSNTMTDIIRKYKVEE